MALSPQQTEELRGRIDGRLRHLIREIQEDTARQREEPFSEHAGIAPDPGDESVASLLADLDQADTSRDLGEVRALDAARARMSEGTYGECVECGNDIAFERLKAEPSAMRCIECQRRHEKTFASPTRPTL